MTEEQIAEVGIEPSGSLFVRPTTQTFGQIYRQAMGVQWDERKSRLYTPMPKELSYAQWFRQILDAVFYEYGALLWLAPATSWTNVDTGLKRDLERTASEATARAKEWGSPLQVVRREEASQAWVHQMQMDDALARAATFWEQNQFAEYAEIVAPFRDELSPAQVKKLDIAERRGGVR